MNVNHLSKDEIDLLLDTKLEKESASFMFEFAKKLKNKKQIKDALCLYEDAYNLKPDNAKYYNAINIAYLYNIVDAIEVEYSDKVEIETLYKNLSQIWRIDTSNWWMVCSDAEFLMLLKVDLAILKINDFLDSHKV